MTIAGDRGPQLLPVPDAARRPGQQPAAAATSARRRRRRCGCGSGLDQPVFPGVVRTPSGDIEIDLSTLPESLIQNQFVTSIGNLLVLDLGMSFAERASRSSTSSPTRSGRPCCSSAPPRSSPSSSAILIGIRAGWKRGSRFDMLSINTSLVLYAVPLFWLGMLLFYFFATPNGIPLFPGQQMTTPGRAPPTAGSRRRLDIAAAPGAAGHDARPRADRRQRADHAQLDGRDAAGGLHHDRPSQGPARRRQVVRRHAIPNALLPTVTVIALTFGYVLGGAIGVEEVYRVAGHGQPHRGFHPRQGLPGAPGDLPGHRHLAWSSPTSSPTCCTGCSTRGCERDGAGRACLGGADGATLARRAILRPTGRACWGW